MARSAWAPPGRRGQVSGGPHWAFDQGLCWQPLRPPLFPLLHHSFSSGCFPPLPPRALSLSQLPCSLFYFILCFSCGALHSVCVPHIALNPILSPAISHCVHLRRLISCGSILSMERSRPRGTYGDRERILSSVFATTGIF